MKVYRCYRVCTENRPPTNETVIEEANNMFACFAVYYPTGLWKGEEEEGLTIEVVLEDTVHNMALVCTLAEAIKHINGQDAVLVTSYPVTYNLI